MLYESVDTTASDRDLAAALIREGNPQRPGASFAYYGDSEFGARDTIIYAIHRESDLLDQSNQAAILKSLKWWVDRDLVWVERFSHFLVGWTDNIVIRLYNDRGQPYPGLLARVRDLLTSLQQYPVLDEDDWGEREWESAMDYLTYEISRMRPDPDDDDPEESDRIRAYGTRSDSELASLVLNYWPDGAAEGSYPDDDEIESIILKHPARYCPSCGRELADRESCPTCPTLFTLPDPA